ncbi:MAG TPA: cbb3-type cytochrome c oxidase subunit I [Solirubrobacterales bacterium]|nr:cbb3-type cytochrome c oxidase subunit I [Solirubrobacterales bacterium]
MSTLAEPAPRVGPLEWVLATDHKRVAARTFALAFVFFIASGVLALLMRSELAQPGLQIMSTDTYNQLFTMHGSGMVYLVVTPLAMALGLYFVPLQVGAADVAAPRLASLGFWLYAGGGLTMYSGFLTAGGAGKAGWTAFYPLSGEQASPGTGMDMWIVGVVCAVAGMLLVAAMILLTLIRHRAPQMSITRIPPFCWTMFFTCAMTVAAFPILIVAMGLLFADRHLGPVFDTPGGPATYQHLFWFYGHPVVYVMFFPFLGVVAEVVATFSRRRLFGYPALILGLFAFTGLSMTVWAHHMFATGQVNNQYYSLTSTTLAIPAGIEYFDVIATMIGGVILLRTSMLFALGFLGLFLIGGLTGIIIGSPPLDYHVHDTYFIVAHFHYTLFGGSLMGGFAAAYYWLPKATGFLLRESLGKLNFALLFVGVNLTFFPMFLLGYDGMQRRVADYSPDAGLTTNNMLATIGAFVIALGILTFIVNVVVSMRRREPAGDDPWQGQTLEWATTSPPPRLNFAALPPIRSYAPLLDLRERRGEGG